ncbi:MAG TPA: LysE family translocator [Streptosporangiaceae bacterium]
MPSPGLLAVFTVATIVLTATPGPGVLYVVGRSVGGGRRSGLASMLGIETGEAVYIAGTALGLTALIATSEVALSILRYGGAAYLVLLGIRAWRQREEMGEPTPGWVTGHWGAFGRGLVVQLLNPKVAVFFVAYFPQFIRPGEPVAPQVLLLGAIYLTVAVVTDTSYVLLASWLAAKISRTERAQLRRARLSALAYFALAGLALAAGDQGSSARAALAEAA